MIISLSHRFLFIHVYKAAGISIEDVLGGYDIRGAIYDAPEDQQVEALSQHGLEPTVIDMQRHVTARDVRNSIRADVFDQLFKFAFVRNPWDLQVSLYHFNIANPDFIKPEAYDRYLTFETYIMSMDENGPALGQQARFIVNDAGDQVVDFIGHVESIDKDFATVCEKIGVPPQSLGRSNASLHKPWQTYYTPEMFDRIRKRCAIDIETFGYSADPADYGIS